MMLARHGWRRRLRPQALMSQALVSRALVPGVLALALVVLGAAGDRAAWAQTKLRVGKAQAETFSFVPLDVGVAAGIFKAHGVAIEIYNFGGSAKLHQAIAADGIDFAVGAGTDLAFLAKGEPAVGIAAMADPPRAIMLAVLKDGPVKTEDDLKGKTISVSTTGSLTYWLAQELARQHGWGPDGIKIVPLGTQSAQIAALKTRQIDGMVVESNTAYRMEEEGIGRVLVKFGDRIKDFHIHVIFVRRDFAQHDPAAVRDFLAGWFESVAYMKTHRDETIAIAARVADVSTAIAAKNYGELMPMFNMTGKFDPKALDVLARSFVEMGMLSKPPDMASLITEEYLPAAR
jgi:NitT/TauT family transport system substrate-binding protein